MWETIVDQLHANLKFHQKTLTFVKNGHCAECGKWRADSLPETGVIWFHQNDLQDLEDLDFIGLTFRPETYPLWDTVPCFHLGVFSPPSSVNLEPPCRNGAIL